MIMVLFIMCVLIFFVCFFVFSHFWEVSGLVRPFQSCFSPAMARTATGFQEAVARLEVIHI